MSNKKAPRICVVINDVVRFDGDMGQWQRNPPEDFASALVPSSKPEPWMKAILITMADAALVGDNVEIRVTTGEGLWTMEVART